MREERDSYKEKFLKICEDGEKDVERVKKLQLLNERLNRKNRLLC